MYWAEKQAVENIFKNIRNSRLYLTTNRLHSTVRYGSNAIRQCNSIMHMSDLWSKTRDEGGVAVIGRFVGHSLCSRLYWTTIFNTDKRYFVW